MSDNKYLRQRGSVWFFQRRIPKAAQTNYGVTSLNRSLGTQDVVLARERRDELIERLDALADFTDLFAQL